MVSSSVTPVELRPSSTGVTDDETMRPPYAVGPKVTLVVTVAAERQ